MANVAANCSIAQPIIPMQAYWDAATPFGDAFVHGAEGQITADNAKEKTEALNEQLNSHLQSNLFPKGKDRETIPRFWGFPGILDA